MSERHIRQERLPQVGEQGQRRLAQARVAIVGCGATGSRLAELLGRAGVGHLRLIDRDVVELSNLQRQALYTTADVEAVEPKAAAAARALLAIDPDLDVDPVVSDLTADNAETLLGGVDLVLDGTDNFPTRMVCNDLCVRDGVPFVYCGVVGIEGQLLVVRAGGPCLRCYVPEVPAPGALPTCETAGVLGTAVALVSALAAGEALKLLLESDDVRAGQVVVIDAWSGDVRHITLPADPACPCCARGEHGFLEAPPAAVPTELCGRDAIQLPASSATVDLAAAAERLASMGAVTAGPWLVRLDTDERRVLLFKDGRVVVGSTRDPAEARSIRARLLGD
jgi:adenylyltransferase/sulfurtransferase